MTAPFVPPADYTPDQFRTPSTPVRPPQSGPVDYTPDQFRVAADAGRQGAGPLGAFAGYDQSANVPSHVHLMVSAQPTSAGKLAVLQKYFPDARYDAEGQMVFTNPATGKTASYHSTSLGGALRSLIDAAPEVAGVAGTIAGGAAGGAAAAPLGPGAVVAGRLAGAGIGAMAKEGYTQLVQALTHTAAQDPSTPTDIATRLAKQAAGGMLAEGTGLAAGAVTKAIPQAAQRMFDAKAAGVPLTVDQLLNLPTMGKVFRAAPVSRSFMASKDATASIAAEAAGQKLLGLPLPPATAANDAAQQAGATMGETLSNARNEPWQVRHDEITSMNPGGVPIANTQQWLADARARIAKSRASLPTDAPPTTIERHLAPAMSRAQEAVDAAEGNASASFPEGLHPDFEAFTKLRSEVGDLGFKAPTAANPATVLNESRTHLRDLRRAMDADVANAAATSGPLAQHAHDALNDAVTMQGTLPALARKVEGAPSPADAFARLTQPIKKEWVDRVNDIRANMPAQQWEPIAQRQWQQIGAGADGNFDADVFLKNIMSPQFRNPAMQSARFGGTSIAPLLPQANQLARTLQTIGVTKAPSAAAALTGSAALSGSVGYMAALAGHPHVGAVLSGLTMAVPAVAERLLNNDLTLGLLNGTIKAAVKAGTTGRAVTPAMSAMFGRWTALAAVHPELRDDINSFFAGFGKVAPDQPQ